MEYDDEVVCIGDLHKKNLTGRKQWNIRRFALVGSYLIYYKQGSKRGEWDISGCTVRKMTPEECNQPAAKFPFGVEGPRRQYLFSASSEKNRDKWISVLKAQIEEFKNPIRRYIRRGEVVLGSGSVKRKTLFGRNGLILVVTNFPRVLLLDPNTFALKEQIAWKNGQSSFTAVRQHNKFINIKEQCNINFECITFYLQVDKLTFNAKFKLTVGGAEWLLEEPESGVPYWEGVFQMLANGPAFVPPKKDTVIKIGIPGSDTSVSVFSDSNVSICAYVHLFDTHLIWFLLSIDLNPPFSLGFIGRYEIDAKFGISRGVLSQHQPAANLYQHQDRKPGHGARPSHRRRVREQPEPAAERVCRLPPRPHVKAHATPNAETKCGNNWY